MTPHASLARSWILQAVSNMPPIEMRSFSEAHRAKLAAAKKGNANAAGAIRTPETRAKLSAARMGNKNALGKVWSEETRAKQSAARSKPKIKRAGGHDVSSSSFVDPDFDDELSMPEVDTNMD